MLSANQPDLGTKRWCDLWQDCTEEQRMELDIRLTAATTPPVTLSDHNSSASGQGMVPVTTRGQEFARHNLN
ncbi:MAG: hypothetical protein OXC82_02685 [Rhodobacteraceae bacterium]|nr:hypothetical protein [Paracoccaceae bacterium]